MVTSGVKLPQIYKYKVFQYQVLLMLNTGTKNHLAGDKKGESETIILQISEDNETISRAIKNLPSHRIEPISKSFFLETGRESSADNKNEKKPFYRNKRNRNRRLISVPESIFYWVEVSLRVQRRSCVEWNQLVHLKNDLAKANLLGRVGFQGVSNYKIFLASENYFTEENCSCFTKEWKP